MCSVFHHTGSSVACLSLCHRAPCAEKAQLVQTCSSACAQQDKHSSPACWQQALPSPSSCWWKPGHGTREQLRLEGTYEHWLVQPFWPWETVSSWPCFKVSCFKARSARDSCQGHTKTAFEYLHGWSLHHLFGKPVPVLRYPHSKVLPDVQTEAPIFHLVATPSAAVTGHH